MQYLCYQLTHSLRAQGAAEINKAVTQRMHCTPSVYKRIAGGSTSTPELKHLLMPLTIPGTNTSVDTSGKILLGFPLALYLLAMR